MANKTINELSTRTLTVNDELEVQAASAGASGKTTVKALTQMLGLKATDYGVVADGVTDDTTNLQTAITAAATAGRVLLLPAGTIIIDNIAIPSGSRIVGEGVNKTIIKRKNNATTNNFINHTSAFFTALEYLTVDGNKANQTVAAHNISFFGCRENFLNNVVSYGAKAVGGGYGCGVCIQDGENDSSGNLTRIINCKIYQNEGDGVYINKDWLVQIKNCRITTNTGNGISVINLAYPPQSQVQNYITITENYVTSNTASGIRFVGFYTGGVAGKPIYGTTTPPQLGCVISNNICYSNGQYGIAFQGAWSTITGNVCSRNGTTTAHGGILCNSWNVTVTGNTMYDNSYYGIDGGGSSSCVFSNNTISYNGVTSGLGSIGLNLGAASGCTASSNIFDNNTGTQITCFGYDGDGTTLFEWRGTGVKICDNLMYLGTGQNGIYVARSHSGNVLLTNNQINNGAGSQGFVIETDANAIIRQSGNVDGVVGTIPTIASAATLVVPDVGEQFIVSGSTGITNIFTKTQNDNSGKIVNVVVNSGGSGYVTAPTVSFTGGGGSGAAGTAYLGNSGVVAGVIMTNRGTGYTSAPTVGFSTGAATATASLGISNFAGRVITLMFTGTLTVTDGGNMRLFGDFRAVPNATLTLRGYNGTWVEVARSVPSGDDTYVFSKTSGSGIKVDTLTPTYAWADLEGIVTPRASAPNAASLQVYRGGSVREWSFAAGDVSDNRFHIPHDYAPGTDIYIHVHWSHNGTGISGSAVFTHKHTYAKGHNQEIFPAEKTITTTQTTANIGTTPQYQHFIAESQLSTPGGSATLLDTNSLEPDGLILVNTAFTTIPTITGGSPNQPFVHYIDIHYQTTGIGTKQKAPNFYN